MADTKIDHEKEILEILAFELWQLRREAEDDEEGARQWRSDATLRKTERESATDVMARLTECGLGVRVSSSKKLKAAIEELITEPAKRSYDL